MKLKFTLAAIVLAALTSINAQEISDSKFGKGIFNFVAKDSSFSIKFGARIQVRSTSTWDFDQGKDQFGSPDHNFDVRRARLKFDGFAYSPKLKYKIELGLSNRDLSGANEFNRETPRQILDAVIMWNFSGNWELWAGQTKLPGNIERVVSSANLQFIDRSLLNSRFNIDRDLGIQIRHKDVIGEKFVIREKFSLSQGEGRNITEGNIGGLQYTGRVEFLPFGEFESKGDYVQSDLKREETPKLFLGFTYNFNEDAVRSRSGLGSFLFIDGGDNLFESNATTIFADAMFKYKGFAFMGEYAHRDVDNVIAFNTDGTTTGSGFSTGNALNLQASYLFKNNFEIAGRFTTLDEENVSNAAIVDLDTKEYTLGVSKFIVGHKLKVQSDLSYRTFNGNEGRIEYRLGFDLHF